MVIIFKIEINRTARNFNNNDDNKRNDYDNNLHINI